MNTIPMTTPILFRLLPVVLLVLIGLPQGSLFAEKKPNFLWILSEDNSKHFLKWFDPSGAPAPNIEKLAAEGLTFDRAFSCSPVCSVARTTLMTSVFAPRLGTQFHRKIKTVAMPEGWRMFPAYLRDAGYYTSNNAKTDYNTRDNKGVWDESSRKANWSKRPTPETPFFHMQTFGTSHEGSLHFSRKKMESETTRTSPDAVQLAAYHPDTPTFRYTYARYHDRIQQVDQQVGQLVARLKEDGLLEDTFIFYFGDHGGVLPGSKGYLRETGIHVPLVVRIPKNWKHLVKANPGTRTEGFVSFVDFGPTLLHLAGVKLPKHLDGRPFLGEDVSLSQLAKRNEAIGFADRFDEKYEMIRSLRQGRYKYVRYYQGYYPDGLQNNYRYKMLAFAEWRHLYQAGKLSPAQKAFFESKPAEALYDIETDPYETRNLAVNPSPDLERRLASLRVQLMARLRDWPDLSFFPESQLVAEALEDPLRYGKEQKRRIRRSMRVADLALLPFDKAQSRLARALKSKSSLDRYWALTACSIFGDAAKPLADVARPLLEDPELSVQVRAAEFLGRIGAADPRPALKHVLANADSPVLSLEALQAVVFLRDGPRQWDFDLSPDDVKSTDAQVKRRLEYLGKN